MIQAIDLSKRYPSGKLALDALNLKVGPGEIYCLLGAAGAGKTTTVDLFLGFVEPTAGKALIDAIEVAREPLAAKRRVALLGEGTSFYDRLTARQNLDLFARLGGLCSRTQADYDMAMREVGLPESAFGRRLREWSPAMRQKLAVAAALIKDVPALLVDEPLSGLDPKAAAELAELLLALRDHGKALLITTHDLFWARQLADRIGILQEGRQALTRSRAELKYENLERLYLDYMRGDLRADGSALL